MNVKGIIFDNNGTLSNIHTDEWHDEVYRVISNLLSYQGITLASNVVRDLYFQLIKEPRTASDERHPEFDVIGIFREIITQHATDFTRGLPPEKLAQLPTFLTETHRAASRFRMPPYPGVEETLRSLHSKYHLAMISDGLCRSRITRRRVIVVFRPDPHPG